MRSLFRRTLTAERACRIARRHLDSTCNLPYSSRVEECRPIQTSAGQAYLVRCEAGDSTYDLGIAPDGTVACVNRYKTDAAPAWEEAPRG